MGKKTMNGEARGRDIHDGKERTLAKLQPTQLALFQMFVPEDDNIPFHTSPAVVRVSPAIFVDAWVIS